jgi:hypothetical protein
MKSPEFLSPPRSQIFWNYPFDISNHPSPGDSDWSTRLYKLSKVIEVQVIGSEVGVRVDAHDSIEEVLSEGQGVCISMNRKYAIFNASVSNSLNVLRRTKPKIGRPHLHPELTSQKDG